METRYEVLAGSSFYGPKAVSIPQTEHEGGGDGYVLRFFRPDGSNWVANFARGWSIFRLIVDYPDTNRTIVVADGEGYVMALDQEKLLFTFGGTIKFGLETSNCEVVLVDDVHVMIINKFGELWQSERISWDGIRDVALEGRKLTGLAYDPTDSIREWKLFVIDLDAKEVRGGSYNADSSGWLQ